MAEACQGGVSWQPAPSTQAPVEAPVVTLASMTTLRRQLLQGTYRPSGWAHPSVKMKRGQTSEHWWPSYGGRSACRRYEYPRGALQPEPMWDNWHRPCAKCFERYAGIFPQVLQTHGKLCGGCMLLIEGGEFRVQQASGRRAGIHLLNPKGLNPACTCCDLVVVPNARHTEDADPT